MKKFISALLTILAINVSLLIQVSNGQGKWQYQNPSPTGAFLYSIVSLNSNNAFAVGEIGTILKTTNKGINWSVVYSDRMNDFVCIAKADSQRIFISGTEGTILRSTNSGANWITLSTGMNVTLNGLHFINSNTGFACGDLGKLIRTTNGGNTWTEISSGVNVNLKKIDFLNQQTGYAVGNLGTILKTTNSGLNWNINFQNSSDSLRDVEILDSNRIIAAGGNKYWWIYQYLDSRVLLTTTNGGTSWVRTNENTNYFNTDLFFINQNTGYISTSGNTFHKTTNAGVNWESITLADYTFFGICATDSTILLMSGKDGLMYRSTNSGYNWIKALPVFNAATVSGSLYDVYFYNQNTGFAVGYNIFKTTNGGQNWINKPSPVSYLYRIKMVDSLNGIAVGSNSIVRTTNGGENWIKINQQAYALYDVYFFDTNSGFITGGQPSLGLVLYSTDFFNNWTSLNSGIISAIYSIDFLNSTTGFITGLGGVIYKTTNRGNNWISQNSGTTNSLQQIQFVNENTGFAVGDNGIFLKTTNSGNQWTQMNSGTIRELTCLKFFNSNFGIISGRSGILQHTQNGGSNWNNQRISNYEIWGLFFHNSNSGYIAGEYSILLNTTNGSYVFANNTSELIPSDFSLYQNYPNPFNPATTIKFDIKKLSMVKISIFDITGKEVEVLVDEKLEPGTYSTSWDGSGYSSGVYFYRMSTEGFTETRKMILIR
jgi:photosystem II stability/assembly factor-like uncharacterized protein